MLGDTAALRRKYGRYLPWQRLNVDQVPLPFVNDMEKTYEEKGAKRVYASPSCINHCVYLVKKPCAME